MNIATTACDDSDIFERMLSADEKLLWSGRPVRGRLFRPVDYVLLVIGLIFAFVPIGAVAMMLKSSGDGSLYILLVFVIPFILIGIRYIALSNIIRRVRMNRYVRYAVTDRRVMIANLRDRVDTKSVALSEIPGLTKRIGNDGIGTIVLGDVTDDVMARLADSGEQATYDMRGLMYLADVPDAQRVFELLSQLVVERRPRVDEHAVDTCVDSRLVSGESHHNHIASYPPRRVHPLLAFLTVVGSLLFQLGCFWLGLTLIFGRSFLPGVDVVPMISIISGTDTASAVITGLKVEGWSEESGTLKKYTYEFTDRNGIRRESSFHSAGGAYEVGKTVTIEYSIAFPHVSRIVGMSAGVSWFAGLVCVLFIMIGVVMLISALKTSLGWLRLLMYGEAAIGCLTTKTLRRSGESGSNGKANFVYDIAYAFKASDGKEHKTFIAVSAGILKVDDPKSGAPRDIPETADILYDPANPDAATTTGQIAGSPRFDRPGTVYPGKPWVVVGYMIVPMLSIGGHVLWWYLAR